MTNAKGRKKSECLNPKRKIATQVSIVWSFGFQISFVIRHLELDGFIGLPALGAAGAIHVRVIRIDIAAADAAEDAVLGRRRLEPAPAQFGINPDCGQRRQQNEHVGEDQVGNSHFFIWVLPPRSAKHWSATAMRLLTSIS